MAGTKQAGVAAVDRAMTILAAVARADGPVTLADLARATRLYKSTILRIVASLEREGMVRRHDDGRFRLGPTCLHLGTAYQRSFDLGSFVLPILARLRDETGESATFYVREGDRRVCLYRMEGLHIVRNMVAVGDQVPLEQGAAGRVLLAFSHDRSAGHAEVRRLGHAVSYGERDQETAAIAAPVFSVGGELVGALSVAGPHHRFTPEAVAAMVPACVGHAEELTRQLGGPRPTAAVR